MSTENEAVCSHSVSEISVQGKIYRVMIGDFINGASMESDAINGIILEKLRNSNANSDFLEFVINSNGGYLTELLQYLGIIEGHYGNDRCRSVLSPVAYSAAAILFLSCKERLIYPFSNLMLHQYKAAPYGTPNSINNDMLAHGDSFEYVYKRYIKEWLTKKERKAYNNGEDIYFSAREMHKRRMATHVMFSEEGLMKSEDVEKWI